MSSHINGIHLLQFEKGIIKYYESEIHYKPLHTNNLILGINIWKIVVIIQLNKSNENYFLIPIYYGTCHGNKVPYEQCNDYQQHLHVPPVHIEIRSLEGFQELS